MMNNEIDRMNQTFKEALKELQTLKWRVAPYLKPRVDHLIDLVTIGKMEAEAAIEYAMNMNLRGSDFDGDWMGKPDDEE